MYSDIKLSLSNPRIGEVESVQFLCLITELSSYNSRLLSFLYFQHFANNAVIMKLFSTTGAQQQSVRSLQL